MQQLKLTRSTVIHYQDRYVLKEYHRKLIIKVLQVC